MDELKRKLEENGKVRFSLLSVIYVIEAVGSGVSIYETSYPKNKKEYESLDDLMDNYFIYNEPIKESIKDITIL